MQINLLQKWFELDSIKLIDIKPDAYSKIKPLKNVKNDAFNVKKYSQFLGNMAQTLHCSWTRTVWALNLNFYYSLFCFLFNKYYFEMNSNDWLPFGSFDCTIYFVSYIAFSSFQLKVFKVS